MAEPRSSLLRGDQIQLTVEQWLAAGLPHVAFRGDAVLYDGGRRHPLTAEEWQTQYCIGEAGGARRRMGSQRRQTTMGGRLADIVLNDGLPVLRL
jgi:hypothetical protein